MFLLMRRMFPESSPAWLAAILLALSPAHFTHSRFAMDYIYPLPFILGWLYALSSVSCEPPAGGAGDRRPLPGPRLLQLHRGDRPHAGLSSPVTLIVLWREGLVADWKYAFAGFAGPLIAVCHLDRPRISACSPRPLPATSSAAPTGSACWTALGSYWRYFSPSFLFFNGGSQLVFSTRVGRSISPGRAAVATGRTSSPCCAAGRRWACWRQSGYWRRRCPAIMLDEGSAINRTLGIRPFGIVLSVIGFNWLSQKGHFRRSGSRAAIAVIAMDGRGSSSSSATTTSAIIGVAPPVGFNSTFAAA